MSPTPPLILLHGLKRSGNHALVNWLRPQANLLFFNNIIPIGPILRGETTMPEPVPYPIWLKRRLSFRRRLLLGIRSRPVLASLEDHPLTLRPFLDPPPGTHHLLLLRDPANLFASRIRKSVRFAHPHPAYPGEFNQDMQRAVDLWIAYAREFVGETSMLENKTCVYFNRWYAEPDYRRGISDALGVKFSDSGYARVSQTGGGSSFDSTTYDQNNQAMRVLDRHAQLSDEERPLHEQILADPELQQLAQRIEQVKF